MSGDVHVQFCEQRRGKFLALTHLILVSGRIEARNNLRVQWMYPLLS